MFVWAQERKEEGGREGERDRWRDRKRQMHFHSLGSWRSLTLL